MPAFATTVVLFFFNDTATTEIYTLSLHDALPICNAARPIVRASVAAAVAGRTLLWDANLGVGPCAAQEFRLVDDRDAERLGLLELGPRVGAHDEGGGLLPDAGRAGPAPPLDPLRRLR